ncbi:MAG: tetratricopeptide repeat protein [Planctomycetes bacterium]|nr:tetratricopeptide repeat protein [Planctomycetota bacterium]
MSSLPPGQPSTGPSRPGPPKSGPLGRPPPSAQEAERWRGEAAAAYKRVCFQDPTFAPHAELVFEQEAELGRGGMGVVLRVRDKRLGRGAALKLVLQPNADLIRRFRREAEITARLDHPGIPPVYEAGTTPSGNHYLLMRLVEGKTLTEAIQAAHAEGAPLTREGPIGALLEALVRISEAVAYAHSQGVIHRDLKPDNVMLGQFGEVLVMDWGLARDLSTPDIPFDGITTLPPEAIAEAEANPALTQLGSVIGSPGYMSPEQAGGEVVDERTDVFALGAILVAILTGSPPVEGTTAINRLTQTVLGKFVLPQARRPDAPAELQALAAAVLTVDREERLGHAGGFLRNLRAYLANEELPIYPYPLRVKIVRGARRHSGLLLAGGLTASLLALAGGLGAALSVAETRRIEAEAEHQAEAMALMKEEASHLRTEESERQAKAGLKAEKANLKALKAKNEGTRALQQGMDRLAEVDHLIASGAPTKQVEAKIAEGLAFAEARFLSWQAAQLYLRAENVERAQALLERSVELYSPAYRERFALHRLETKLIMRAAFSGKIPLAERLRLANKAIKTRILQEISRIAKEHGDKNAFALYGASIAFHFEGDADRALSEIEKAIKLLPTFPEAWIFKGRLLRLRGEPAAAVAAVRRGVEFNPRDALAWTVLVSFYSEQKDTVRLLEAHEALANLAPNDWINHHDRSIALSDLGRFEEAIEAVKTALKLAPDALDLRLLEVETYLRASRYKESVAAFRKLRTDPAAAKDEKLWFWGAEAELEVKDLAAAKASVREGLSLNPDFGLGVLLHARILRKLGERAKALVELERVKVLLPGNAWAPYFIARIHHYSRRYAEAIEAYTAATQLSPRIPLWLSYRGYCRWELKQFEGALADFTKALAINPRHEEALAYRGRLHLYAGRPKEALADLRKALKIKPTYHVARMRRGAAYLLTGDKKRGLRDLERAVPRLGKRVEAFLWRGRARAANGQSHAARADFELALTYSPNPQNKAWLEEELAKLK